MTWKAVVCTFHPSDFLECFLCTHFYPPVWIDSLKMFWNTIKVARNKAIHTLLSLSIFLIEVDTNRTQSQSVQEDPHMYVMFIHNTDVIQNMLLFVPDNTTRFHENHHCSSIHVLTSDGFTAYQIKLK